MIRNILMKLERYNKLAIVLLKKGFSSKSPNKEGGENIKKYKKLNDFILGWKAGWKLATLPDKLLLFDNSPWIRIFRVIGGLSLIVCLGKGIIDPKWIIYILPITFIYCIYISIILIFKIKHMRYLWKTGKLDFRNSPIR